KPQQPSEQPCKPQQTSEQPCKPQQPSEYGKIVSTKAILDKNTNQCKEEGGKKEEEEDEEEEDEEEGEEVQEEEKKKEKEEQEEKDQEKKEEKERKEEQEEGEGKRNILDFCYYERVPRFPPYQAMIELETRVEDQLRSAPAGLQYSKCPESTEECAEFYVHSKFNLGKQQEQDPTNLYISNLPISMDEQELENMLKPFGHVISTRILRDASGVSRGVGFARMESTEKCEVVIQHFNGKYLKTPPGIP
ncbi:hypothetical protein A6R68_09184, partial [Neotoma lepida]